MRAVPPLAAALVCLLTGCTGSVKPSPAADAIIAEAETGEERDGLKLARDDIDDEMRRVVSGKDAEIQRLRRENEELRMELGY